MSENFKRLTRSTTNRMVAGVAAGLAEYLDIDPTIVRLMFVLGFFMLGGGTLLVYLIMAIVTPEQVRSVEHERGSGS